MRFASRVLLVVLLPMLLPLSSRAATITTDLGTVSGGARALEGEFLFDNDIALFYFTLGGTAIVSAEITSHLATPAGFDPILTLFGSGTDYLGAFDFLESNDFGFLDPRQLQAGTYLLAVTQYNNYFAPGGGFDYDADPDGFFTNDLFGPANGCAAFVDFSGGCRDASFFGTLSVEQIPEPGSLSLLAVCAVASIVRRQRNVRSSTPAG